MDSACLNRIGISPQSLLECSQKYSSSYGWFTHRLSISREDDASKSSNNRISSPVNNRSDLADASSNKDPAKKLSDLTEELDPTEFDGFEFRLDDPVIMLPADELFSDGKLIPLQLSVIRHESATSSTTVRPPDDLLFSPRAPRCSSRWKELLGFGKVYQNSNNNININNNNNNSISGKVDNNNNKRTSISSSHRSIRQFLHRSSKSSNDSSINLPLLKDNTDNESAVSVSSRPSLSSSSSGHDLDDLPRLSLDSDKPNNKLNLNPNPSNRPKTRMVKTKTQSTKLTKSTITESRSTSRGGRSSICRSTDGNSRGMSVDSPRMSSSGKIVFHSLERSSSSPSSFNGGPRFKHKGMERSYSANVRITPVLNVPVCSLRGSSKSGSMFGFPIFSSQQKREGGSNRSQRFNTVR